MVDNLKSCGKHLPVGVRQLLKNRVQFVIIAQSEYRYCFDQTCPNPAIYTLWLKEPPKKKD